MITAALSALVKARNYPNPHQQYFLKVDWNVVYRTDNFCRQARETASNEDYVYLPYLCDFSSCCYFLQPPIPPARQIFTQTLKLTKIVSTPLNIS